MLEKSRFKRFSANKVKDNRVDTPVFKYGIDSDRYGNESYSYSEEVDFTIPVMWTPINSQVEIAEYGERVNEMLQGYLFSDEDIAEKDRVLIDLGIVKSVYLTDSNNNILADSIDNMLSSSIVDKGVLYNVVSVKKYPHFRIFLVERVR